jgi:hypothetical protein
VGGTEIDLHGLAVVAATTWLVGESATTLSVSIKCSRTKYNEISKQHEEPNSVINVFFFTCADIGYCNWAMPI